MERCAEDRKGRNPLVGLARIVGDGRTGMGLALILAAAFVRLSFRHENAFTPWIAFALESGAGIGLVLLLVVNLLTGLAMKAWNHLKQDRPSGDRIHEMDASALVPGWTVSSESLLLEWLKRKGFRTPVSGPCGITAIQGRWSFLPEAISRVGAALLLLGLLASRQGRMEESVMLSVGREAVLLGSVVRLISLDPALPNDHLQVGKERNFRLESSRATIRIDGQTRTVTSGWPEKIGGMYLQIGGVGYVRTFQPAPDSPPQEVFLDVLPPGRKHAMLVDGRSVTVSVAPVKTVKKGRLTGDVFNIRKPVFQADALDRNVVRIGPPASPDGSSGVWVGIRGVRDPGRMLVLSALTVLGFGLTGQLFGIFWCRRVFLAVPTAEGLLVGYSESRMKKWGVHRFLKWRDEGFGTSRPENPGDEAI